RHFRSRRRTDQLPPTAAASGSGSTRRRAAIEKTSRGTEGLMNAISQAYQAFKRDAADTAKQAANPSGWNRRRRDGRGPTTRKAASVQVIGNDITEPP